MWSFFSFCKNKKKKKEKKEKKEEKRKKEDMFKAQLQYRAYDSTHKHTEADM